MSSPIKRRALDRTDHHSSMHSDATGHWLFFASFLAGAALISVLEGDIAPVWLCIAAPLGVMAVYTIAVSMQGLPGTSRYNSLSLRADQTGDNVYYLGFLFTLTSLLWALYRFDADSGAEGLIQNFGVALVTTVFGLAARVWFSQFRLDIEGTEQDARLALVTASSRLRAELDQSADDFASHRRAMQQTFEEALALAADKTIAHLEAVATPVEACGQALGGIATELQAVQVPRDKFDSLAQEVEHLTGAIRAIASVGDTVESLRTSLNAGLEPVCNELEQRIRNLSRLETETFERLERGHGAIHSALQGHERTLTQLTGDVETLTRLATTHANGLGAQLERSRGYTEQVHGALVEMTSTLASELGRTEPAPARA